jgi:hypothetical protein
MLGYRVAGAFSLTSRWFGGQRLAYGFYRPFERKEQYIALYVTGDGWDQL